ncbi:hypothetical protein FPV67DRAFT_1444519 [Lyophyllum atratum]|nr:hypothetical protein FPV67DRAFT_1444519 [Lyophyllum atratum]
MVAIAVQQVTDLFENTLGETIGAPAYTTDKQVFHTDFKDIIARFALETAAKGGTSRISSTWKAYNELAETRPDLIKTLSEPWPSDGFFTGFLALPRSIDIPAITEAQAEALDALHFLGKKYNLGLSFQKGDTSTPTT